MSKIKTENKIINLECEFLRLDNDLPCHNKATHKIQFRFAEKYICYDCLRLRKQMIDKMNKKVTPLKVGR